MGRPKPNSRVLPSPFLPTRSASSPALSGELQKMRYLGLSAVAGASCFAEGAGGLGSPAAAQAEVSRKRTSPNHHFRLNRRVR